MTIKIKVGKASSESVAYARTNERIDDLISAMEGGGGGQAEVIDIRNGYDETQYSSAGEAVRTQISDVYEKMDGYKSEIDKNVEDISIRSKNLSIFNALTPDTQHRGTITFIEDMDLSDLESQINHNYFGYVSDFIEIPQENCVCYVEFYTSINDLPQMAICDENKKVISVISDFVQTIVGEEHFATTLFPVKLQRYTASLGSGKYLIVCSSGDISRDRVSIGSRQAIEDIASEFDDYPNIFRNDDNNADKIFSTGRTVEELKQENFLNSNIGKKVYRYEFPTSARIDTFKVTLNNTNTDDILKFTLTEWDGDEISAINIMTHKFEDDKWVDKTVATAKGINDTIEFKAPENYYGYDVFYIVIEYGYNKEVSTVEFEFYNTNEKTLISEFEKTKDEIQKIDNIIDVNNNDIKKIMENIEEIKNFIGMNDNEVVGIAVNYKTGEVKRLVGGKDKTDGDDFNIYPMYGGRKRCNVNDDGEITAWYGDDNFTDDGTNGQVMVYQPVFWYKVNPIELEPQNDGIGYHIRRAEYYVGSKPRAGFKRHPLFYDKNGDEIDFVLLSAYEGCIYDTSEGQYLKNDEQSMSESEDKFSSISDAKPASGKTQSLTRLNVEKLAQNRGEDWHGDLIKAESANQLLMIIEMGAMNLQTAIGQGVVSVADTPANENNSIKTGATSELGNYTGQAEGETGKAAISYRGMENPWGNIFKFVYGVNIHGNGNQKGGIPYICNDFEFAESQNSDNYESAGFTVTNANGYISAMGYGNEDLDWIFFASETLGTNTKPVGDSTFVTSGLNEYKTARLGGLYNSGTGAGGLFWNLNRSTGGKDRNNGGRLVYVPTKQTAKHYYTNIESWKRLET